MSTRTPIGVKLAVLAASTLVALLLVELVARAFAPPAGPSIRFAQDVEELRKFGRTDTDVVLQSDPDLFWTLVPDRTMPDDAHTFRGVIANGQGLREDHAIAVPKPEGELRILFLGDSCTFGTGLALEQGFVQRTEALLRERFPGRRIECVNAGVPGYTLFQGWRVLERRGPELEPDLVVSTFGWNDSSQWDTRSDLEHFADAQAARPPGPLAASRFLGLLWSFANRPAEPAPGAEPRARLEPAEFIEVLDRVRTRTRELGADLLLVVWPVRYNLDPTVPPTWRSLYQKATAGFAEHELDTPPRGAGNAVDLVPVLRELAPEHGIPDLFQDHVHATAIANDAYARAIAERIALWIEPR
jgi:lysophospholipase L1-like esterase